MIGHKLYQILSKENEDTWVTLRNDLTTYKYAEIYNSKKIIDKIDLIDFVNLQNLLNHINPDIIINASGVTIRRGVENMISSSILLNSALPHFLNEWVCLNHKRLVHFSTDCVFSGKKGTYSENDIKDAIDTYGLTKSLGEVINSSHSITLRGSMIGRELENKTELLEWFLKQNNKDIRGFSEVMYSGITTVKMAEIVLKIIFSYPKLSGLFNVSSEPLSKFELLQLFNENFNVNANIESDSSYSSNKNLISNRFFTELKIDQPIWVDMVKELKYDCLRYKNLYD